MQLPLHSIYLLRQSLPTKAERIWIVPQHPLSVRFNGHFPGEPELDGDYWSKGWRRWWWQLEL